MENISKEQFSSEKEKYLNMIKQGSIFIYPTDTIYGIGCDATNEKSVKKIREAKQRSSKPFSVIAPSKDWILENCEINNNAKEWLDKLPGPYTLILKLKNKAAIATSVNSGQETLGIRIPDNWFSEVVAELNIPIITTSVNITGKQYMTSSEDIEGSVKEKTDFMIYEGKKKGNPSTVINLTSNRPGILER
jgi:L-threonylcarbamoyladenylate synthase